MSKQPPGDAHHGDLPTLHIVIVNWRAGDFLARCLDSIAGSRTNSCRLALVTVVDNDSSDGSIRGVANRPLPLRLISNPDNVGFARACNMGADGVLTDFLLFLNPDTILEADTLDRSVAGFLARDDGGLAVLGIQLCDPDGHVSRTCSRFPTVGIMIRQSLGLHRVFPRFSKTQFMLEWDHQGDRRVDQVIGAYFLVRAEVFRALGGFDERFFLYFEEVDFCFRAYRQGLHVLFFAGASAVHVGRSSSDQVKAARLYFSLKSRLLFFRKHKPGLRFWVVFAFAFLVEPLSRIVGAVVQRKGHEVGDTLRAYRRLLAELPGILTGGGP